MLLESETKRKQKESATLRPMMQRPCFYPHLSHGIQETTAGLSMALLSSPLSQFLDTAIFLHSSLSRMFICQYHEAGHVDVVLYRLN
jgi:hypothetical protein